MLRLGLARWRAHRLQPVDSAGNPTEITIATFEGTVLLEVAADIAKNETWFEWTPTGDRVLLTTSQGPAIVDVPSGAATRLEVPFAVDRASWIGTTGDILLTSMRHTGASTDARVYRLAAGTTTGAQEVATIKNIVSSPLVSPDGSKFMYFIWGPEERLQGRIHVFDFATGQDIAPIPEDVQAPADVTEWENPVWAPDGSRIAAELYTVSRQPRRDHPGNGWRARDRRADVSNRAERRRDPVLAGRDVTAGHVSVQPADLVAAGGWQPRSSPRLGGDRRPRLAARGALNRVARELEPAGHAPAGSTSDGVGIQREPRILRS